MIYKMLEAGTRNLTNTTIRLLEDPEYPDLAVYPKKDAHGSYGFFVAVPEIEEYQEIAPGLPDDLKYILQYALERHCCWVMFDTDAENNNLPVYN